MVKLNSLNRFPCRVWVLVVTVLAFGAGAFGDAFSDIMPNPRNVSYGTTQIGSLKISDYKNNSGGGSVGAELIAEFTQTYMPTCDLGLQWIQSVYDGRGTIGQNDGSALPYLDPYQRDDNLPFYWTNTENAMTGTGRLNAGAQPGTRFSDFPSQDQGNSGNFIKFEAALVAVSPTDPLKLTWLTGFTWGYQVNADKTSTVYAFSWLNAPTANLTGPVQAWDGTLNNKGGGKPVGYQFINGQAPPCPLPTSAAMGVTILVAMAVFGSVRHRLAPAKMGNEKQLIA